ncbi:hypothetical protein [Aneurinibacillus terranovensis]|uniref:hypothetical protein n=1 Tax=Aneurinibacillus terranovensis TaxID=278991 RepID=UPI000401BB96|nr:hypothetical protein [Aneurinibacillus terranovensis]
MRVEVEATDRVLFEEGEEEKILTCLTKMQNTRKEMVRSLRERIEHYEKKRAKEQAAYQKMSALRRWIAGKTPDHHLAVENLVYIKQPMQEIERINAELQRLQRLAEAAAKRFDEISIPLVFIDEFLEFYMEGTQLYE